MTGAMVFFFPCGKREDQTDMLLRIELVVAPWLLQLHSNNTSRVPSIPWSENRRDACGHMTSSRPRRRSRLSVTTATAFILM
jgi:hypothetical protein